MSDAKQDKLTDTQRKELDEKLAVMRDETRSWTERLDAMMWLADRGFGAVRFT